MPDKSADEIYLDIASSQEALFDDISLVLDALSAIDPDSKSSAVLKVASVIAKLGSLFSPDPVQNSINRLAHLVHDYFRALRAEDAAQELLARTTVLNGILQNASDALADLSAATENPAMYPAGTLILKCQESLTRFFPDDDQVWNVTFPTADLEKLHWTDEGRQSTCYHTDVYHDRYAPLEWDASYGTQAPPLNDDQVTVFEYRVALPMFLWVISTFLLVGRQLDPGFVNSMRPTLAVTREKLRCIHDRLTKAGSGLTALAPPPFASEGVTLPACPLPEDGMPQPRSAVQLVYGPPERPGGPPTPVGAVLEYGAVEKYSGVHSVGDGYRIDFVGDTYDAGLYDKLQIRVLKRMKDVYVTTGLLAVWKTMGELDALLGAPPAASHSYADWSMRDVLSLAHLPPRSGGQSVSGLAAFLIQTQPYDTPYGKTPRGASVSLRRLLTEVPN